MSHPLLSHLSKNNNCPNLVQKLFDEHADGVKMIVTSRFEETALYHVYDANSHKSKGNEKVCSRQISFSFV